MVSGRRWRLRRCPFLASKRHWVGREVLRGRVSRTTENARAFGAFLQLVHVNGVGILVIIAAFTLYRRRRTAPRTRTGFSLCRRTFQGSLGTCPMECGCRPDASPKFAVGARLLPKPS